MKTVVSPQASSNPPASERRIKEDDVRARALEALGLLDFEDGANSMQCSLEALAHDIEILRNSLSSEFNWTAEHIENALGRLAARTRAIAAWHLEQVKS